MTTAAAASGREENVDEEFIDSVKAAINEKIIDETLASLIEAKLASPFSLTTIPQLTANSQATVGTSNAATPAVSSVAQPNSLNYTPTGVPLTSQPTASQTQTASLLESATDWTESIRVNNVNSSDSAFFTNVKNARMGLVLLELLLYCESGTYNGDLLSQQNENVNSAHDLSNTPTTTTTTFNRDNSTKSNANTEQIVNLHATMAPIVMSMIDNIVNYLSKHLLRGSFGSEDIVTTLDSYSVPVSLLRCGSHRGDHGTENVNNVECNKSDKTSNLFDSQTNNVTNSEYDFDEMSYSCFENNNYNNSSDGGMFDNEEFETYVLRKRCSNVANENVLLLASQCLFLITRHFQLSQDAVKQIVDLVRLLIKRISQEINTLNSSFSVNTDTNTNINSNVNVNVNNTSVMSNRQNDISCVNYCHNKPSILSLYTDYKNAQLLSLL